MRVPLLAQCLKTSDVFCGFMSKIPRTLHFTAVPGEMELVESCWGTACFVCSLAFSTVVAITVENRRHEPIVDWFEMRYLPFLAAGCITDLALRTLRYHLFYNPDPPMDKKLEQKSWLSFALMNIMAHFIWKDTDACLFSAFTGGCSLVWLGRGIICP